MNINSCFKGKYLKASDLPEGKVVAFTIDGFSYEMVGQGENQEERGVVHFKDQERGLVLNKTNANTISEIAGSETDTWPGTRIGLYQTPVQYGGKTMPGIRVKKLAAAVPKPAAKPVAPPVVEEPLEEIPEETIPF